MIEIVVGEEVWNKSKKASQNSVMLASLNYRINASIVSSMVRMRYGRLTSCYHLENGGHFDDLVVMKMVTTSCSVCISYLIGG